MTNFARQTRDSILASGDKHVLASGGWKIFGRVLPTSLCIVALALSGCGASSEQNPNVTDNAPANLDGVKAEDDSVATKRVSEPADTRMEQGEDRQTPETAPAKNSLQLARVADQKGDIDQAEKLVMEHLIQNPNDVDAIFLSAQLAAGRGRMKEAAEALEQIPADHPQAGLPALGQSADWYLQSASWEQAEKQFRKLLRLAPQVTMVHRRLAYLMNRQGRRQEASHHVLQLCLAGDVTQAELHTLINRCEAVYSQDADERGGQFAPIGPTAKARILYSENRLVEALDLLFASARKAPLPDHGHAFFGRIANEVGDTEAVSHWISAMKPGQNQFADHWVAVGIWLSKQSPDRRDIEDSAGAFATALKLNPTDWLTITRLENCFDQLGDDDLVQRCRELALEIRQTIRFHSRLVGEKVVDAQIAADLVQSLDGLGRNLESVMWQAIIAASQNASQDVRAAITEKHRQLVSQYTTGAKSSVGALPGLELDKLSLPGDWKERLQTGQMDLSNDPGVVEQSESIAPEFVDVANQIRLDYQYVNAQPIKLADTQLYEQFGGAVAATDFDLDGAVDLYFGQSGRDPKETNREHRNVLFRNIGGQFIRLDDVGCGDRLYSQGVSSGDWNQDGFPDLLIANFGINRILVNQGDGKFRPAIEESLGDSWKKTQWTTCLALADIDGDHLPDLYEVNYADDPKVHDVAQRGPNGRFLHPRGPQSYRAAADRAFLSNGDGTCRTIQIQNRSGDRGKPSHGLGVVITNLDGRRGNEIFVANDTDANQLWVRDATDEKREPNDDWPMVEVARAKGCAYSSRGGSGASMGIATADFDGNGTIDLHVANFLIEAAHLYLQNEIGIFEDSVVSAGLLRPSVSVLGFGTQAIDFDNNRSNDLVVLNGHIDDYQYKGVEHKMRPQIFENRNGEFTLAKCVSSEFWDRATIGRGLLKLDWNRDGRLDLVATHHDEPAAVLENRTDTKYRWIQLMLVGVHSERDAIGARVSCWTSGGEQIDVVTTGDGFACKNESMLHFGLGDSERIDRLEVQWPTGTVQEIAIDQLDARYLLIETQGDAHLMD